MDIFVILETMLVLFLIMFLGYAVSKIGIIDPVMNKKLSALVVNVLNPAMILSSVMSMSEKGNKSDIFFIMFLGIVIYFLLPIVSKIAVKPFGLSKIDAASYRLLMIFANTAFIGYPLVASVFGDSAVFSMAILNLPFNILLFTYGIRLMVAGSDNAPKFSVKDLLHPGAVASFVALIIYLLDIPVHNVLTSTISLVGSATVPLSMLIIGANLSQIPVKEIFGDRRIYPFIILKMLIIPAILFLGISFFVKDSFIQGLILITLALPSGAMNVMIISEYKGNVRFASSAVFLTTLVSIITMPLLVYIFM